MSEPKVADIPQGLHEREYAMKILSDLSWPDDRNKTNLELIMACLNAIKTGKRTSAAVACFYLLRAIYLAQQQGITVDRMFFLDGKYNDIRREGKGRPMPEWKPIDWEEVARHQKTPEFQAAYDEARKRASEVFGIPLTKGVSNGR